MSLALREAISNRWRAAGLDVSIAPLYPGEAAAAPEGTALPRAAYSLPSDTERSRSRGSRELRQTLRFQVWAADDVSAQQFVDLVETAFVDSETATADPLAVPASVGKILAVDYETKSVVQTEESVFLGSLELRIQWARPSPAP